MTLERGNDMRELKSNAQGPVSCYSRTESP
jgi:hypothetical protein